MEALLRELWQLREIQELAQLMESGGGPALGTGLSPVHRAMTAAALRLKSGRPLLMLCADEGEARRQAADLRSLTGRELHCQSCWRASRRQKKSSLRR